MPERERFHFLDLFRGLAALWVLLCHSISWEYTSLSMANPIFSAFTSFMALGHLGVPIFFVISGYGIAGSVERHRSEPFSFLKKRLLRIYPAYWISLLLAYAVVALIIKTGFQKHAALPPLQTLLSSSTLLMIPNLPSLNPIYWSLGYIVHFYLIAFIALWVARGKYFFGLMDGMTVFFLLLNTYFVPHGIWTDVLILRYYWVHFYCGVLIYRLFMPSQHPALKNSYCLAWLAVLAYLSLDWRLPDRFAVFFSIALIALKPLDAYAAPRKALKPLFWLSTISYSLYLTHILIGPKLLGLVNRMTEMGNSLYLITLFVGSAGSIALAAIFYRVIERPLAERSASIS